MFQKRPSFCQYANEANIIQALPVSSVILGKRPLLKAATAEPSSSGKGSRPTDSIRAQLLLFLRGVTTGLAAMDLDEGLGVEGFSNVGVVVLRVGVGVHGLFLEVLEPPFDVLLYDNNDR